MPDIYLLIEGQPQGPYAEDQVRQSLAEGLIPGDLPAWHEGLENWASVADIIHRTLLAVSLPLPLTSPAASPALSASPILSSGTANASKRASFPWYRSSLFVGLIIGIPWLLGPFLAVFLKPLIIAGLVIMLTGPIYYKRKGEVKMLARWYRWLAGALLLIVVPYYLSILVDAVHPSSPQLTISRALQQDYQLGRQYLADRDAIHSSGATGDDALDQVAQLTADLVSKMKTIPISNCPPDFREAYTRHINCWSYYAEAISHHPHIQSGGEAVVNGFLRGLSGDPTGGAFEAQDEINSYLRQAQERDDDVTRSWGDVSAIAVKYGVQTSDYSGN
jgi:hypothetical protein